MNTFDAIPAEDTQKNVFDTIPSDNAFDHIPAEPVDPDKVSKKAEDYPLGSSEREEIERRTYAQMTAGDKDFTRALFQQLPADIGSGMHTVGRAGKNLLGAYLFEGMGEPQLQAQSLGMHVPGEPDSNNGESPIEEGQKLLPPAQRALSKGVTGLIESAPQMAAVAGGSALGIPPSISGAAAFGLTPEGFDPEQGAIGAILPIVGKYTGAITESAAKKFGISPAVAESAFNRVGGASGAAGLVAADQMAHIMQLPPEQRKDAIIDAVGNVVGMAGLGAMGEHGKAETPVSRPDIDRAAIDNLSIKDKPAEAAQPSQPPPMATLNDAIGQKLDEIKALIAQQKPPETAQPVAEQPLNTGGSEAALPPDKQALSKQNNSREAFEALAKATKGATPLPISEPSNPTQPLTQDSFFDEVVAGPSAVRTIEGKVVTGYDHADARSRAEEEGLDVGPKDELGQRAGWMRRGKFILAKDLDSGIAFQRAFREQSLEGKQTPAEDAISSQKFKIGNNPQTHEIVERLPQSETEKANGEQPVKVKNDRTGEVQTVTESDLTPVKARTAEEKTATAKPLDDQLREAGLDPSVFPNRKSKQAALKRQAGLSEGPGAASPGDVPTETELSQLTSTLKDKPPISERPSFTERLGIGDKVADKYEGVKDAVSDAYNKVKGAASSWWDSYKTVPKSSNFVGLIKDWQFARQKSDLDVMKFGRAIREKVPDPVRREGITNWIQADGDGSVLRDRAESSKGPLKTGYLAALDLNAEEKTLARNIQSYFESQLKHGADAGILKHGVENYISQIWKRENPVTQKLKLDLGGKLQPNFKFAKQRVFDSYFEGEQAGYKPLSKDVAALVGIYDQSFQRAIVDRSLIKALHSNVIENGEPMAITSGSGQIGEGKNVLDPSSLLVNPGVRPKSAESYSQVNNHALKGWKWVQDVEGHPVLLKGDMLVHPEIAGKLKALFEPSALRGREGERNAAQQFINALFKLQTYAKQTKLSGGVFHQVQEGIHAIFHRTNPFDLKVKEIDLTDPNQKQLVRNGLQIADHNAMSQFMEGVGSHGGLLSHIPGIGDALHHYGEYLFKDYIPRLKMSMALNALDRNMEEYKGKLSDEQIYEMTARQGNAAFGEQNYRLMFRSPMVQDFARIFMLAPDFLESRMRFVGQALKPYGKEQRAALMLGGLTLYAGMRVINQMTDNDPHYDKPFSVILNGREYTLRTIFGDIQHAALDPRSFIFNRFSVLSRTFTELATGRDDRGIKRSGGEMAKDFLAWFKPIAIDKRDDSTYATQALQSTGLGSKPYTQTGEMYKKAREFRHTLTIPKEQRKLARDEAESHMESDYRKLRVALQMNDIPKAEKEYQALLEMGKEPRLIKAEFNKVHPFTGSAKLESQFVNSLSLKDKENYQKARQEQREIRDRFNALKKK